MRLLLAVLRRAAPKVGLTLDSRGYARLDDVVRVPDLASFAYTTEELQFYAREDCVGRLEVSGDGECIRATFGHAAALGVAITHPPLPRGVHVVAEVARAKWPRVRVKGLFSKSKELLMLYTGDLLRRLATFDQRRHRDGFLVYVDVQRARQDGIEFFVTSAGAVLTTGDRGRLPPTYFVRVIDSKSGADVTAEMPASAELRPQASSGNRIRVALPSAVSATAAVATAPAATPAARGATQAAAAAAPGGAAPAAGNGNAAPRVSSSDGVHPSPAAERSVLESRGATRAPRSATPQAPLSAAVPDVATPSPVATLTRRECELLIAAADTLRLGGGPALPLDDDGFVPVATLCERAPMRAYALDRVLQVFALDPLGRVEVHGTGAQAVCRATFGQSTSVGTGDLQGARSAHVITAPRYLPSTLMLPVSQRQWEHTVRNSGLLFRERRSVGLLPPALVQALRDTGELPLYDYVIVFDAKALLQSGAVLWRLAPAIDKGVVLTDGFDAFLPCDYFSKVVRVADEQVLPRSAFAAGAAAAPTANEMALASAAASVVASSPPSRRASVASTLARDAAAASVASALGRRGSAQSLARDAPRDVAAPTPASPASPVERSPVGLDEGASAALLLGSRRESVLSGLASDTMSPGASRALVQRAAAVFVPSVPRSPTMRIAVLPTPAGGQTPLSPSGGASRGVFQRGMSALSLGDADGTPDEAAARGAEPVPAAAPASSPLGKPRGGMSQFVSEAQQHSASAVSSSSSASASSSAFQLGAQRAAAPSTSSALHEHLVSSMLVRGASAKEAGSPRGRAAVAPAVAAPAAASAPRADASGGVAPARGGQSRAPPPPDAAALPTTALGRATPAVRDRDNDELARLLRASSSSSSSSSAADTGDAAAWGVIDAALACGKRVLLVSPPATGKSELASIVNRRFGTSTEQLVDFDDLIDLGQMFHVSAKHKAVLASDASNLVACANADTRNRFFIGYLPDAELYRRLRNFAVVALDIAANSDAAAERACVDRKFDPSDRAFHPGLRTEYEAMRGDARALVSRLLADGVAACRVPLSEALLRRVFPQAFRSADANAGAA